jgi:phosphoglycolate phosphatase
MTIDAILFDKDGTLYDFHATWSAFAKQAIHAFPGVAPERVADALGFDMVEGRFRHDAPFVSGTAEETATLLSQETGVPMIEIRDRFDEIGRGTPQVPVPGVERTLAGLAPRPLGVATNDAERSALAHLAITGISDHFSFVAGYDSGFGSKPGSGQLRAFAGQIGIDARRIAMVGDSAHDLTAARDAGMVAVAVLTGTAMHETLQPLADVVLPDVTHLLGWLEGL